MRGRVRVGSWLGRRKAGKKVELTKKILSSSDLGVLMLVISDLVPLHGIFVYDIERRYAQYREVQMLL